MDRRIVGGFAAGGSLGAIAGWLGRGPVVASGAPDVRVVEVAAAPGPSPGVLRPPSAAPSACPDELATARTENAVLTEQLRLLGGARSEWPADVPAVASASAVRAWIDGAVAKAPGVSLEELDCDEFPCVAFVRYPDGAPGSSAVIDPITAAFREAGGAPLASVFVLDHQSYAAIGLAPAPLDPTTLQRLQVRDHALAEAVGD